LGLGYFFIALIGLLIGLLYNVKPIYAKKNPVFGMLLIGVGYGVLMFLVGWGIYQPFLAVPLWILGFLYIHEVIFSASQDFSDISGDSYANVKTIPTIFGKKKGALICYVLYLIPYVILLILKLSGYITNNIYPVVVLGLILGVIVFGFCGLYEKKFSYIGYFLSIILSVVVKITLFFSYVQ
jgi:4-hydroxybenzoate polyprenyltransferase